jgi:hypothetical protein
LHRYLYAFGNPTVYVDPDGRQARSEREKRIERLQREGGMLLEGMEPPPGTEIDFVENGVTFVRPIVPVLPSDSPAEGASDDRNFLEVGFDFLVSRIANVIDSGGDLLSSSQRADKNLREGINRPRSSDVEAVLEARQQGNSPSRPELQLVAESTKDVGTVVEDAGRTALAVEEAVEVVSVAGVVKGTGRRVLRKDLKDQVEERTTVRTLRLGTDGALEASQDSFERAAQNLFRKKIIKHNEIIRDGAGNVIAEIDFETEEAVVEVGKSLGQKSAQLFKLAEIAKQRSKRLDVIYDPERTPRGRLVELRDQLQGKFGNRVRFIPLTED